MKDKFIIFCVVCSIALTGCVVVSDAYNKSFIDLKYNFNYAQIKMPDGTVVEGKVQTWTDFEDGDQIQVKIDGKTYLTHSCNVVLVEED